MPAAERNDVAGAAQRARTASRLRSGRPVRPRLDPGCEAWDIADTVPLLSEMEIVPSADYADLGGSEAVVVTVGSTTVAG